MTAPAQTGPLRLGTRPSALAVAQSELVAQRLRDAGHTVELVTVSTSGDRSSAPIATLGVGVFVSQLRDALVAGEVDLAVHSYKDLPTAADPRLVIAAVPPREDPRDALVARDGLVLGELPAGATVGTGSPRRVAQLEALGLGLRTVPIRGNVDTRIGKVRSGELDAVVVAAAGLRRLGRIDEAGELLDPLQMLPAPAQGALAVECRAADTALAALLAQVLDDAGARAAVTAERAVLATLEAGCSAPDGRAGRRGVRPRPTTAGSSTACSCARWSARATVRCCARRPPATSTTSRSSVRRSPRSCSTWGRGRTAPPAETARLRRVQPGVDR